MLARHRAFALSALFALGSTVRAQEGPFFVAYDHHMEEPGSLELSLSPVFGHPRGGHRFVGGWAEFEYGLAAWWTSEVYLNGQRTWREGSLFTGWRWENRFRLIGGDHAVNPVFYAEYENLSGADKAIAEVVGFDGQDDQAEPIAETRREREREVELKAILGTDVGGWNVSENLIAVKNIAGEPWEFGYAVGTYRPLTLAASPSQCRLCGENFSLGVEVFGGLGDAKHLTLRGTSHYIAPLLAWRAGHDLTLRVSPGFGLTSTSHRFLLRVAVVREFSPGFVLGPR